MRERFQTSWFRWLLCGLLAGVTLAVYLPAALFPYINLDDPDYLINNLHVRQGLNWETVRWAFTAVDNSNWHPLTTLSNALLCQIWGLDPVPQHAANLIVHALDTVLVFLLLLKLTGRQGPALFVALLFGLHPMHVESVVWVSERKDVLSAFFFLLTLLAYGLHAERFRRNQISRLEPLSHDVGQAFQPAGSPDFPVRCSEPATGKSPAPADKQDRPAAVRFMERTEAGSQPPGIGWAGSGHYWLALGLFGLGLMCKPMLVTLPLLLLLLDYWPLNRLQVAGCKLPVGGGKAANLQLSTFNLQLIWEKLPFFVLAGVSSWLTIHAQNHALISAEDFPLDQRLAHIPVAYCWYGFKLFWPVAHSIYYILHVRHSLEAVTGALLVLGLISAGVIWAARRQPWLLLGWLWFLVMLIPVVGFVQAGCQAYAERYTYLPYLGLFIGGVWTLAAGCARFRVPGWAAALGAILIVAASLKLTRDQISVWASSERLFQQAVDQDPRNEEAWILYGLQFNRAGNPDRAIDCMRQTLAINPGNAEAWNNLGRFLVLKGEYAAAQNAFETALRGGRHLTPVIHKNLADLFAAQGKTKEAIASLESSLRLQPDQPVVVLTLAASYAADRQYDRAIEQFEALIGMMGDNADAEMGLADAYGRTGRYAQAVTHYRRALALKPALPAALNNLAWLLATTAEPSVRNGGEAVRLAAQACQLTEYKSAFYLGTLAAAYAEAGQFDQAIATAQKAMAVATAQGQADVVTNNARLLEVYKTGRPYHEPPPTP